MFKVRKQNSLSETESHEEKEPQTLNSCAGRCSNRSLICTAFTMAFYGSEKILTQYTGRKGKRHVLSCIQGTPRPGFCLPTSLLQFHLAKLTPDNEVRRKILKWPPRTRAQSCRRRGRKKKKGISCLLLWEKLCLLSFSGSPKPVQHVPCQ